MLERLANLVSRNNRIKKYKLFISIMRPDENTKILDVGPNDHEYSINDNMLEKLYPWKSNITALGLHDFCEFSKKYEVIKAIKYDGKIFPFKRKTFDICSSNAVIEHVGGFDRQVLFIKEVMRTCKKAFITTPNRFFPVEVHSRILLLHYLPKRIFDCILRMMGKGWASGEYMYLLSYKNIISILKAAGVSKYKIIKNRFFFLTMDYIIILED